MRRDAAREKKRQMDKLCPNCQRTLREAKKLADSIDVDSLPKLGYQMRHELPEFQAIYFALRNGSVVYIGETDNVRRRWKKHIELLNKTRLDDLEIAWYQFRGTLRHRKKTESQLIQRFHPVYSHPGSQRNYFGEYTRKPDPSYMDLSN